MQLKGSATERKTEEDVNIQGKRFWIITSSNNKDAMKMTHVQMFDHNSITDAWMYDTKELESLSESIWER